MSAGASWQRYSFKVTRFQSSPERLFGGATRENVLGFERFLNREPAELDPHRLEPCEPGGDQMPADMNRKSAAEGRQRQAENTRKKNES